MKKKGFTPGFIAVIAMFTALAYVSVIIAKPIPNVAGFLSYEPKDAIIVIAGLLISPLASALISLLVSFIEMITISTTGPYGLIMNVLSTCAFAVPAAWIYHKNRTKKGAVIGLATGVICMVICMLLWNYIITPLYMKVDRSVVAGMMLSVFLPFNLIKGGINAGITLLLYKPIVSALRSAKLVEASPAGSEKGKFSVGFFVFSLAVLATFVLAFLALVGVL
ncbi:MAG: ECF transporter S component [Lachnospiraceae bacterium]|jgi:riboflavin transporter FmnP|nr:ECF transporter S component [Lachnospiraceae bacterium]